MAHWKMVSESKLKFENIEPVPHYVCSACGAFGGFVKPKEEQCRKCGAEMDGWKGSEGMTDNEIFEAVKTCSEGVSCMKCPLKDDYETARECMECKNRKECCKGDHS